MLKNIFSNLKKEIKMNTKIFISHSYKDKKVAKILTKELSGLGYNTCDLYQDISSGIEVNKVVKNALDESNVVIALVSSNWLDSQNSLIEFGYARAKGKKIIPVLIDDINTMPIEIGGLKNIKWKDFDKNIFNKVKIEIDR